MNSLIESLESRTLLSAAPSVVALRADGKALVAAQIASLKGGKVGFKLIQADLKAANELKASRSLVRALAVEGRVAEFAISRAIAKTIGLISFDVIRFVSLSNRLAKHPTDTLLAAKVIAARDILQANAATQLATINNDVASAHDLDATNTRAIVTANSGNAQLVSDVTNVISVSGTSERDTLLNAANTALTTGVNNVIAGFTP